MTPPALSAPLALTPEGWDTLAARFGCSQKVSQGPRENGSRYLTEYLPRTQSARAHDRRFTITIFRFAAQEAAERSASLLDSLTTAAMRAGSGFRECLTVPAPLALAAFLDYSEDGLHTIAAAIPLAASHAGGCASLALLQLTTSNGTIPALAEVQLLRSLVVPESVPA